MGCEVKVNRTINCFILSMIIGAILTACQHSEKKQNFSPQKRIDTTLWLKETRGIRDILEDNQGKLWFSSPDYVARFDGKKIDYFSENEGLSIRGNIHEDVRGNIWVEDGFRAFRYDGENFSEEKIEHISTASDLWIQKGLNPADTTYVEAGLYQISQHATNFYPLPIKKAANNKYLYFPTTKAIWGKDSTLWIGTMEKAFGFKDKSFTWIGREEMGRQDDERQMGIRGLFVDSKGKLWIADNGAGVFVYDGKETINFSKKHRLDQHDVEGNTLHRAFSIAEDTLGNMWFGTVYSGIWSFNPKTEEFINYTEDEGVKSENIWMIYRTKKGSLLFAGESPGAVYEFNGKTFDRIF